MNNQQLAILAGRISLGINFTMHGLVRMPKLTAFASGMSKSFADSIIPEPIVYGFAIVLAFAELLLGICLLIGLKVKWSLFALMIVMSFLIAGSALLENWSTVGTQMVYVTFIFLMIRHYADTPFALKN